MFKCGINQIMSHTGTTFVLDATLLCLPLAIEPSHEYIIQVNSIMCYESYNRLYCVPN